MRGLFKNFSNSNTGKRYRNVLALSGHLLCAADVDESRENRYPYKISLQYYTLQPYSCQRINISIGKTYQHIITFSNDLIRFFYP